MPIIPPSKKSGFTLIEIVIVLSIASLILVLVFVGVDGAVKANQNEQRRSDAKKVLSAVISNPKLFDQIIASTNNSCYTATTSPCSLGVTAIVKQALDVTTFEDPTQVSNTNNTLENTAPGSKDYAVVLRPGDATGVAPKIEIRKDAICKKTGTGYTFQASQGSWAVISILGPFYTKSFGTQTDPITNVVTTLYQIYGSAYCVSS
jgi:prepilin-type N-terminal cleavage/methylation domain-containing protein